jgi:hypothetical protein
MTSISLADSAGSFGEVGDQAKPVPDNGRRIVFTTPAGHI